MARTPLSYDDYFENAFTDQLRAGWAEDYDNNVDMFYGRTYIVGPTNADYVNLDEAFDSVASNERALFLVQTGTHFWPSVTSTGARFRRIAVAPLSGIYGDVTIRGTNNTINHIAESYANSFVFDKIKFLGGVFTRSPISIGTADADNETMRMLFAGCHIDNVYTQAAGRVINYSGWTRGSVASTGTGLSRSCALACTFQAARSDTSAIYAPTVTSGNILHEVRRCVYNYSSINNTGTYGVLDIEDLSLVETATHGADAAKTVLPIPPDTLGYIVDYTWDTPTLTFSTTSLKNDLASVFFENTNFTETHFYEWFREFRDTIRITDGLGILEVFYERVNTSSWFIENKQVSQVVAEALAFTLVLKATQSYALSENLNISYSEVTNLTTAKIINDSLDVISGIFAEFVENVLENVTLNETDENIPQRIMAIYDAMGISDSPHYASVFARNITETIYFLDSLIEGKEGIVADSINLSVSALKLVVGSILTDICAMTTSFTNDLLVTEISTDTVALSESFSFQSILNGDISDGVVFSVGIPLDDNQYAVYVINTETSGLSEYTNSPFNSISGEYAATETGIYKLTGDTEDGDAIIGSIKTGLIDFGTSLQKQVPYAYIGCDTDGRLVLKVTTTHKDIKKERWYEVTETRQSVDTVRIQLSRGIKSRYYQFELTAIDGTDFNIDSVELLPLTLPRRI